MRTMLPGCKCGTFLVLAALASFGGIPLAGAAEEYLILSAEPAVAELPPGKVFTPSDVIDIPAGTTVTLLGEDGSLTPIRGPSAFVVTRDGPTEATASAHKLESLALVATLLTSDGTRNEAIGGSRTAVAKATLPALEDPWTVMIEDPVACIRKGELLLARRGSLEKIEFSAHLSDGERFSNQIWPTGSPTYSLAVPTFSLANVLTIEIKGTSAMIELKRLPDNTDLQNPTEVLGWMLRSGCKRQALAFIEELVYRRP